MTAADYSPNPMETAPKGERHAPAEVILLFLSHATIPRPCYWDHPRGQWAELYGTTTWPEKHATGWLPVPTGREQREIAELKARVAELEADLDYWTHAHDD